MANWPITMNYNPIEKWHQLSENGEAAHFYGANGFALGTYQPLLGKLSEHFALSALHHRATWPNEHVPRKLSWQLYADDLIQHIESNVGKPVIGIGHSMGATATIFAAVKRPDLFSKLVLIEPAMTSRLVSICLPFVPFNLAAKFQPIKYTVEKPAQWQDEETFYADCRKRRVFKRFDDSALKTYAKYSLSATSDQSSLLNLAFPKQWEAKNYTRAPYAMKKISQLSMPVVAIRGKPSLYFSQSSWEQWQRTNTNAVFLEAPDNGHLLPLEAPEICYELIYQGLKEL